MGLLGRVFNQVRDSEILLQSSELLLQLSFFLFQTADEATGLELWGAELTP